MVHKKIETIGNPKKDAIGQQVKQPDQAVEKNIQQITHYLT